MTHDIDETVKLDEPKFIRFGAFCFYCFGNCDLCKIRFNCWSGKLEFDDIINNDESLEIKAFGDNIGRIIQYAIVVNDIFRLTVYYGNQLDKPVYKASKLLYLNDKKMLCCHKKPMSVHHVKNW
jgi:hypothetical protein